MLTWRLESLHNQFHLIRAHQLLFKGFHSPQLAFQNEKEQKVDNYTYVVYLLMTEILILTLFHSMLSNY